MENRGRGDDTARIDASLVHFDRLDFAGAFLLTRKGSRLDWTDFCAQGALEFCRVISTEAREQAEDRDSLGALAPDHRDERPPVGPVSLAQ